MKILLVEDSQRLQKSIRKGLENEGFVVDGAVDGVEGFALAESYDYDVVILDLMLPGMDGLSVLTRLRAIGRKNHVLILSAKDQVGDRVRGLELGADDYLIKPFEFEELVARVRALVRRKYHQKDPWIGIGKFRVQTSQRKVYRGQYALDLSPKEYALLEYLLMRRGRVVSRESLIEHLYDGFGDVASNVVDVMVCNLRRKMHGKGEAPLVETKRGFGYLIA